MFKTLLKSVREYKLSSILCPLVMVGEASMEIIIPFLMTFLIGEIKVVAGGGDANVGNIVLYSLLMIAAAFFSLFCGAIGGRLAAKASCGFAHNLREDMYGRIQNFSFSNIDKFSTASLITRVTTDVTNVQNAYQMCIRMLVRAPILFVFAAIASFMIDATMGAIFIGGAVVLGVLIVFGMFVVMPYFRTMFKKYDGLNSVVQEDLTAIRVVKSYVREDHEIEKMSKATGEVYEYSIKAEKLLTLMMPLVSLVMYATIITILVLGSNMILGDFGGVGIENIQALITYAMQVLSGVMMIAMCLSFISMAKGSADRICEVLTEEPTIVQPTEPVTEVKDGSIEFSDVDFSYSANNEMMVLKDITVSIASGETVGVIGATGSGKTTFVSLIPRLYDVTQGSVKVGGVDVREYDKTVLRNNVAMVLQKNVLFSGSVKQNLKWGNPEATDEEIEAAAKQACADEFIGTLVGGYDYDLGQGGVNVSGGQKQRLCIARALLKNPKIIIFDDSTSAVDTKTDAQIRAALKKFAPDTTKIIIAQRISSVQESDKIIVLDEGRICGVGTHDELMQNNEIYREVYESQVKGGDE